MRRVKRVLSLFLSVAMVVTGVNLGTLMPVRAAEIKDQSYFLEVEGSFQKSDANSNDITVATANDSRDGSKNQAPYISGETANGSIPNCGSDRYGCLVFTLPNDLKQVTDATVSFSVSGANNADHADYWTKAALYQTANGEVTASDESTYRAINEDYSFEAAMWSDKKVTSYDSTVNEAAGIIKTGELNFNVKKALQAAVEQGSGRLVLRLQAAKGGLKFDVSKPVKLNIDTTIPTTATVKYVDGTGNEIQESKTVGVFVDSEYTYDVSDDEKILGTDEGKYYVYDEEHSERHIQKIKEVVSGDEATQNIITLKYNEITITAQSGVLELETCAGSVPNLPDAANAVFSDDSIAAAAVEWDAEYKESSKYQEAGATVEATGKFKGTELPVKATVKVVKNLEQLNEDLAAWYPLDEDAKDASGKGNDGTAAETVEFSRTDGATFNGGNALQNMIMLPTTINVTDNMTFAFWVKDEQGSKSNAFGIGSSEKVKEADGSEAHLFYVNTHDSDRILASMNPQSWVGGSMVQIATPSEPKSEWHHITCVLEGKMLTLYVNGEKIDTVDAQYTVKEMWDYEPATRWAYIGNCIYGKNGDKDFKGSIRDFRIYNAALAQAQVTEAYNYKDDVLPLEYAKDDLVSNMTGVKADYDGNLVVTNVTAGTDSKITLPTTSYGDAAVTWESENAAISLTAGAESVTGTVTVPAAGADEVQGKLKATITLGDKQVTAEFECAVFGVNADINVEALEALIDSVEGYKQDDYTAKSWTPFVAALATAKQQARKPIEQTAFESAKGDLEGAKAALVDIAALRTKVAALENELAGMSDDDKELYTKPSRDALDGELSNAKALMAADSEASQNDIDTALENLPAKAVDALARRGVKTALNALVAEAEAVKANKADYKTANWEAFEAALTTAETQKEADLTQAEIDSAVGVLKEAMEKLEPIDTMMVDKAALATAVEEAKAESASLTRAHYTTESWTAYQEALAALEAIADKPYATTKDVDNAKRALADAYANLRPTDAHAPTEAAKSELKSASATASQEAASKKSTDYTKESWARYEAAVKAMEKVAANIDAATTEQITAVSNELAAAKSALVDKSKLDKAITDCGSLKSSAYTSATWNDLQTALNSAKSISAKTNATQQEIDSALAALNAKKGALKSLVKVTKVTVSADSKSIAAGKKANLTAKITPSNATTKTVNWKSSNTKYATVKNGVVTTKKAGAGKTVTITATAADGSNVKGTVKIKIMKNSVKKVTLKAKTTKVKAGKKVTVKATVSTTGGKKGSKTTNKTLAWKTSNKKYATVSSKGVVTTKKAGKGKTVTITATSTDGTKKSGKVKIKITK